MLAPPSTSKTDRVGVDTAAVSPQVGARTLDEVETRELRYFVAVAEHGSVTQAAQRCNVSQPSVSVAIADLEAIIGRKLFHRGAGQKLSITPAGRQLLVDARTTLAAAGTTKYSAMLPSIWVVYL